MTISTLPKIIRIEGKTDYGEYGAMNCPHCDAKCRYVTYFDAVDADGNVLKMGAAAGCFTLFPISKLANLHSKLLTKQADYAKKEWTLNRADTQVLDLIQQAATGTMTEDAALSAIRKIQADMAAWRKNRYNR